jgi:hypothetical protein
MQELIKNREGNLVSTTHRECSNSKCDIIFKITSKTVTLCPKCNSERVKSINPIKRMLARAKSRSKTRNHEFNIEFEDIIVPEYCPILNIKLEYNSGRAGGESNSPSLDRIDNTKGYVKGNVIVISQLANCMKSSSSPEELKQFAKWINKEFPD